MISSVFGKTKPINYIILLSILFVIYWAVNFYLFEQAFSLANWVWKTIALGFLMFTLFVVNFVVKRNQITESSTYAILFFTLFIAFFPEVLRDTNAIFCGFFISLAFRRIVSLRSLRNVKLKLFDASLWIVTASIFYDWALVFMALVFIAIYMYEPKNFRNWLIPIAAATTVLSILFAILSLSGNTTYLSDHFSFTIDLKLDLLYAEPHGIKIIGYVLLVLVTGLLAFARIGKLGLGRILSMRLIVVCFIVGLLVTMLETSPSAFPVFITFFPGATLVTKYVETIKRTRLKEVFLTFTVLIPLITWIAQHVVN
ncbi:hypothetical protein [Lentiprolixibacter aurantiacus]|uniref:Uncharacterized protein n=1 Tax=Lentiprolixibacter aurantiacus TaxID=2993939 RepID=A0AAE3SMB9_9FLAO|nr:hypothetical protein [Lentiprolixibacter aurantiacus]MCX2718557.1 hypothetical protein [Lentiprolixibacter aurantiacus]